MVQCSDSIASSTPPNWPLTFPPNWTVGPNFNTNSFHPVPVLDEKGHLSVQ